MGAPYRWLLLVVVGGILYCFLVPLTCAPFQGGCLPRFRFTSPLGGGSSNRLASYISETTGEFETVEKMPVLPSVNMWSNLHWLQNLVEAFGARTGGSMWMLSSLQSSGLLRRWRQLTGRSLSSVGINGDGSESFDHAKAQQDDGQRTDTASDSDATDVTDVADAASAAKHVGHKLSQLTGYNGTSESGGGKRVAFGTTMFWVYVSVSVCTTLFAGFASGLTVGFLSIDPIQLKVLCDHGTDSEKKRAQQVSKIVENHHLLLVTLLLANSIAMETLPLFLDRLIPSWLAVILSVTCILFFGEVLPQAFCTGPQQLSIAAASAPAVKLLIAALFMIAWPIARVLDHFLGHEAETYYSRPHLKTLIRMHQKERRLEKDGGAVGGSHERSDSDMSALGADEVVVIEGALDLASKTLKQIMIPMDRVYMLEWRTKLTRRVMQEVVRAGHSRVPIYRGSRHNVRGLILVKSLILASDGVEAHELLVKKPTIFESPDANAYEVLNEFQKGASHMAFITEHCEEYRRARSTGLDVPSYAKILGVATLEDVIEELIQEEIYDEFDDQVVSQPQTATTTGHTTGHSKGSVSDSATDGIQAPLLLDCVNPLFFSGGSSRSAVHSAFRDVFTRDGAGDDEPLDMSVSSLKVSSSNNGKVKSTLDKSLRAKSLDEGDGSILMTNRGARRRVICVQKGSGAFITKLRSKGRRQEVGEGGREGGNSVQMVPPLLSSWSRSFSEWESLQPTPQTRPEVSGDGGGVFALNVSTPTSPPIASCPGSIRSSLCEYGGRGSPPLEEDDGRRSPNDARAVGVLDSPIGDRGGRVGGRGGRTGLRGGGDGNDLPADRQTLASATVSQNEGNIHVQHSDVQFPLDARPMNFLTRAGGGSSSGGGGESSASPALATWLDWRKHRLLLEGAFRRTGEAAEPPDMRTGEVAGYDSGALAAATPTEGDRGENGSRETGGAMNDRNYVAGHRKRNGPNTEGQNAYLLMPPDTFDSS